MQLHGEYNCGAHCPSPSTSYRSPSFLGGSFIVLWEKTGDSTHWYGTSVSFPQNKVSPNKFYFVPWSRQCLVLSWLIWLLSVNLVVETPLLSPLIFLYLRRDHFLRQFVVNEKSVLETGSVLLIKHVEDIINNIEFMLSKLCEHAINNW